MQSHTKHVTYTFHTVLELTARRIIQEGIHCGRHLGVRVIAENCTSVAFPTWSKSHAYNGSKSHAYNGCKSHVHDGYCAVNHTLRMMLADHTFSQRYNKLGSIHDRQHGRHSKALKGGGQEGGWGGKETRFPHKFPWTALTFAEFDLPSTWYEEACLFISVQSIVKQTIKQDYAQGKDMTA